MRNKFHRLGLKRVSEQSSGIKTRFLLPPTGIDSLLHTTHYSTLLPSSFTIPQRQLRRGEGGGEVLVIFDFYNLQRTGAVLVLDRQERAISLAKSAATPCFIVDHDSDLFLVM